MDRIDVSNMGTHEVVSVLYHWETFPMTIVFNRNESNTEIPIASKEEMAIFLHGMSIAVFTMPERR